MIHMNNVGLDWRSSKTARAQCRTDYELCMTYRNGKIWICDLALRKFELQGDSGGCLPWFGLCLYLLRWWNYHSDDAPKLIPNAQTHIHVIPSLSWHHCVVPSALSLHWPKMRLERTIALRWNPVEICSQLAKNSTGFHRKEVCAIIPITEQVQWSPLNNIC